ncbi:hypothetical protein AB0A77_28525 [Streptomyces varsoviensis]|uniref:hypothetical protein n=1 Tax=Streptomyces varsoviensis TaxID=67373 RepID=UPI0033E1296B
MTTDEFVCAALLSAVRAQLGEWTTRRATRALRDCGFTPQRATVRQALHTLTERGQLIQHDNDSNRRYFTLSPTEDTPAARLAEAARTQPDLRTAVADDATTLTLTVQPRSRDCWDWWLAHVGVPRDGVTLQGPVAVATGHRGGVTVHLRGISSVCRPSEMTR